MGGTDGGCLETSAFSQSLEMGADFGVYMGWGSEGRTLTQKEKRAAATSDLVQNGLQNVDLYRVRREERGVSVPCFPDLKCLYWETQR